MLLQISFAFIDFFNKKKKRNEEQQQLFNNLHKRAKIWYTKKIFII